MIIYTTFSRITVALCVRVTFLISFALFHFGKCEMAPVIAFNTRDLAPIWFLLLLVIHKLCGSSTVLSTWSITIKLIFFYFNSWCLGLSCDFFFILLYFTSPLQPALFFKDILCGMICPQLCGSVTNKLMTNSLQPKQKFCRWNTSWKFSDEFVYP